MNEGDGSMLFRESETIELKEVVVDEIKKEIIAFANCDGGKLYIGVQDDGTVVGVDDPDGVSLQISNMVRDAIKPDVTMFVHYKTIEENGKDIVAVDIQRGTDRPYYLAEKRDAARRRLCQAGLFFGSCYGYGNPPYD